MAESSYRRRWRLYRTATGARVVEKELDALSADDAADIVAEMKLVAQLGLRDGGARHLRNDIWEVRSSGRDVIHRALFAKQGRYGHILLALHVFTKKTQKTPSAKISVAERRLADWQTRPKRSKSMKSSKK